ncbi:hypothetical protein [Sporolactobacillus terrae]|uniref:hypothetical protein n=1 Tax=Sporolactobacillus terrae TaxID=269673 RepID=UPI001118B4F4|nr:hypothetical protein [Sporolactobacillus terrae]
MFENNRLYFIEETGGYLGDDGLWVDGSLESIADIPCDKQPYSHDLAYRDYGYDGNVVYRVFCDYNDHIKLGATVSFTSDHAEEYQIKKIVNWDNQTCEVLVDDL